MVQLVEARDLVGHDLTSKSDPYVKLSGAYVCNIRLVSSQTVGSYIFNLFAKAFCFIF